MSGSTITTSYAVLDPGDDVTFVHANDALEQDLRPFGTTIFAGKYGSGVQQRYADAIFRIQSVELEKDEEFYDARLAVFVHETTTTISGNLSCKVALDYEDVASSAPFSTASEILERNWVDTGIEFRLGPSLGSTDVDVSDVLRAIIGRDDWQTNNTIAFRLRRIPMGSPQFEGTVYLSSVEYTSTPDFPPTLKVRQQTTPTAPLIGDPPTIVTGSEQIPKFEVIARDIRTGRIVQHIPRYEHLSLRRRMRGVGEWSITLPTSYIDTDLLSSGIMFQIRRRIEDPPRGWPEIVGPVTVPFDYSYAPNGSTITFSGQDLKALMQRRLVASENVVEFHEISAEQAMVFFVEEWVVKPWNQFFGLDGARMVLQATNALRGGIVDYNARFNDVLSICNQLGLISELWYDVVFDDTNNYYRFEIYDQIDAGRGTSFPWIFSTRLGNISRLNWLRKETATIMHGIGPADETTGVRTIETATRTIITDAVEGIPYEKYVDLRFAGGSALANQTLAYLMEEAEAADQIRIELNQASINEYHKGWDLGYRVGIEAHEIGQYTERVVQEVLIEATGDGFETVGVVLGDPTRDLLDLMDMYQRRATPAQTS